MAVAFVIVAAFVAVYLLFNWVRVPLPSERHEADRIDEEPTGDYLS